MKKQIIFTVILIPVIALCLWGIAVLRQQSAVRDAAMAELSQLETQTAQLQQDLAGLNTAAAEDTAAQADRLQQQTLQMQQQLDPLREEIEALNTQLEENSDAIAGVKEDIAYLEAVYDALEEGLAYVRQLIAES